MADRYSKTMLTVIAGCLLYLCVTLPAGTPKALAATHQAEDVTRVVIVGVGMHSLATADALPVNIDQLGGAVLLRGTLPVEVAR